MNHAPRERKHETHWPPLPVGDDHLPRWVDTTIACVVVTGIVFALCWAVFG